MREGYCSCLVCVCVCVCVCACLSVKSHLTSGASVRSENAVKYSVCNVGRKTCRILSQTVSFQSYHIILHCTATVKAGIFSLGIRARACRRTSDTNSFSGSSARIYAAFLHKRRRPSSMESCHRRRPKLQGPAQ